MAYQKATLESFQAALKSGKYATLGGVRKAISKMSDFSEKEKEQARAMVDKHFDFGVSAGGAPVKKAPKSAKKSVKGKKAPKAAKSAKRAAKAAPVATSSALTAPKTSVPRMANHTSEISLSVSDNPGALRWAGAGAMISTLGNRERTAYEEKTYRLAHGEAQAVVSNQGRHFANMFDAPEEIEEAVPPLVSAPPPPPPQAAAPVQPKYPRIQIPQVDESTLSPEDKKQHDALKQAAAVAGIKPAGENQVTS